MNALIVCQAGKKVGLGHLSRSIVIAKILKKNFQANVKLLIQGNPVFHKDLVNFKHDFFPSRSIHSHLLLFFNHIIFLSK
jgi:spore coat polysaccharide biosynthesis predicted glycosyltransferase SpsG